MSGISTGDWGATWEHGKAHCWATPPLPGIDCWHALCGRVIDRDEPTLVPGNGEVCDACREIVERAAMGVPQ